MPEASGERSRQAPDERGSAALTSVAAMGMFLVILTLFVQFAVWQYGRGVLRSAALEAARAQAGLDASAGACERRFGEVRSELLGGDLGEQVSEVRCQLDADRVVVSVDADFEAWLPISPDWSFTVTAIAVREVDPS